MPEPRIAITGASGLIGRVLLKGLGEFKTSCFSLPWSDLRKYTSARRALAKQDIVIHLAWDTAVESVPAQWCSPDNTAMFINVYRAALENKVKRLIMASSVHADDFYGWKGPDLLSVDRMAAPRTAYGAHKLFMESLGQHYSRLGVEIVCLRFGGVQRDDRPPQHPEAEHAVFLSHEDCVSLVKAVIKAPTVPNGFSVVYGVSDTPHRRHEITNPFGWSPKPMSATLLV